MKKMFIGIAIVSIAIGCTTKKNDVRIEPQIQEVQKEEQSLKRKVAIARFSNETEYAKGAFYDKANDPVGKQAGDILATKFFILASRFTFCATSFFTFTRLCFATIRTLWSQNETKS